MRGAVKIMLTGLLVLAGGLGSGTPASAGGAAAGWMRQFGTSGADETLGVALDSNGNAYVVGWVFGTLPGQSSSGTVDAFVRKYDPAGQEVWTRQFGSWDRDFARMVALDGAGGVYVVGETEGTLPGQRSAGGQDAFLRKYDASGREVWTRQFGGGGGEGAWGVALDQAGNAYLAGTTRAALPGQTSMGDFDGFLRKYDPDGIELWTRQFGSGGGEGARRVAVDGAGNIVVIGTTDGSLSGNQSAGGFDAYIRQYDPMGRELWTRQFGSEADDYAVGVAVDEAGRIWLVGSADRALPGQLWAGSTDAFISQFAPGGTPVWTQQFGTDSVDEAWDVAIDRTGEASMVGSTERDLPGQRSAGRSDFYVRKYDATGAELWTRQFGTGDTDLALAVAVDNAGDIFTAGSTRGTLPGQSSAGGRDAVLLKLSPK